MYSAVGVEASIDALLSPTHLIVLTSLLLVFSGPLLSLWLRSARGVKIGWKTGFPAVMSLMIIVTILTAFTDYLTPFSGELSSSAAHTLAAQSYNVSSWTASEIAVGLAAAAFLVSGAFIMGMVLTINRKLRLPFGAWTLTLWISAAVVGLFWSSMTFVPVAALGGLLIDVAVWRVFTPGVWQKTYYGLAFGLPVTLFTVYFAVLLATNSLWWNAHIVFGCVVYSGIGGALIAYLIQPSYRRTG